LSVFITPWMEPMSGHSAEIGLARHHPIQECTIGLLSRRGIGVVTGDHIVRQPPQSLCIAPRGDILESADADVAGGHARKDGTGQGCLAQH
jgi:hypothetical protein